MGADSVAYHQATVMGRADDHPGQALAYYASRGETPLVWGGSGAVRLGLAGRVTEEEYAAIYGPGGAKHPRTGGQLAATRRPGMELVVSAHKSVAELGVIGRAEDMHRIMDAERDATLAYLEAVTRERGGRRGRLAISSPTGGLVYAHTRHATSRAGDPCPHDHVLMANVVEMLDDLGRLEGGRHHGVARAPPRRHRRRPHGRSPGGGRTRLRHRSRPRPVGPAGPLADRRDPRRGPRRALQAGRRDRRRRRRTGLFELPGPQHRRPRHPRRQAPHPHRGADAPLAPGTGRGRLVRTRPGRRRRPRRSAGRASRSALRTGGSAHRPGGARPGKPPLDGEGLHRHRRGRQRLAQPVRAAARGTGHGRRPGPGRTGVRPPPSGPRRSPAGLRHRLRPGHRVRHRRGRRQGDRHPGRTHRAGRPSRTGHARRGHPHGAAAHLKAGSSRPGHLQRRTTCLPRPRGGRLGQDHRDPLRRRGVRRRRLPGHRDRHLRAGRPHPRPRSRRRPKPNPGLAALAPGPSQPQPHCRATSSSSTRPG